MGSPSTGTDWNSYFWQRGGTVNCRRSAGLEARYIRTGSSQGCKDTYKMVRMSGRGERCPARLLSAPARSCGTAALAWGGLIFGVSPWARNAVAALGIAAVGGSVCMLSTGREWIWRDICGAMTLRCCGVPRLLSCESGTPVPSGTATCLVWGGLRKDNTEMQK